ncbi:hypothetical protein T4D_8486 [Trichinella pseudospiralis]|uniref:Uncharacterized protein n=1 Tax=Trichinella pseudospiralis TaxID=6337 RepID=A0A0V1F9A0_TRIPS|nr:hypothetical protein T4D_8486 [Trichinella pseudospiralis]
MKILHGDCGLRSYSASNFEYSKSDCCRNDLNQSQKFKKRDNVSPIINDTEREREREREKERVNLKIYSKKSL